MGIALFFFFSALPQSKSHLVATHIHVTFYTFVIVMRVLIVNTAERTGGAAIAANRLLYALNHNGVEARMLVRDRKTDAAEVVNIPPSWGLKAKFLWERGIIWLANKLSKKLTDSSWW